MLGFQPPDDLTVPLLKSPLRQIDEFLIKYDTWNKYLDNFIYLKAIDCNFVIKWRTEAEENRKTQGNDGMTTSEISSYIKLFLPAYKRYQDSIHSLKFPGTSFLNYNIGQNRLPYF